MSLTPLAPTLGDVVAVLVGRAEPTPVYDELWAERGPGIKADRPWKCRMPGCPHEQPWSGGYAAWLAAHAPVVIAAAIVGDGNDG